MKSFYIAAVIFLTLPLCADPAGLPAADKPIRNKFIGEPGSPSGNLEVHNALENVFIPPGSLYGARPGAQPGPEPDAPSLGAAPALPVAVYQPVAVLPIAGQPVSAALARPTAKSASALAPISSDSDRSRYSLWDGLVEPLELPTDKVRDASPDIAASLGRRDYDTHILRQSPAPAAAASDLPGPSLVRAGDMREGSAMDGEIFVSMNMDLSKEPDGSLKDAVADLGKAAGFRQDLRFAPAASGPGRVELWGWMPSNRIGEAMTVASVAGVAIHNKVNRTVQTGLAADMLIGLRLPPGTSGAMGGPALQAAAAEALARLQADLAIPGLRVKRGIGTQKAPGSGDTVLVVEASVPIAALSRILAHRDVLKTVPAPQVQASRPARQLGIRDFISYARQHSPLLLVFTLLLMLPAVGDFILSAARVFIPYR
ncbi:MAG: hypothetical protein WC881_00920 [Elusimicrobiota bacterium]|jgi:hypothetical protein